MHLCTLGMIYNPLVDSNTQFGSTSRFHNLHGLGPLFAQPAVSFGGSHLHRASPASGFLGALLIRCCSGPVGRWILSALVAVFF
jgi:hypothetical protein